MIARFLGPDQQGFYYTFSSILGLQIFFELGFSHTLMQCVSHENAHLVWTGHGTVEGSVRAKQRLATLFRVALRWYGTAAALSFTFILPAGLFFFRHSPALHSNVAWRLPWVWLATAEAIMLFASPFFAFLEGSGLVAHVALVRLTTSVLTSLSLWLALSLRWALLASPIVTTVGALSSTVWIAKRWGNYFKDLLRTPADSSTLSWRHEIWPFQWRIIVTWLSFYFMSQLAIPVLFRYQGPIAAGQMGLSISVVLAGQAIGLAWMSTKVPQFGGYVARGEFEQLDSLFSRTLKQALFVLLLVSLGLFVAVLLVNRIASPYSLRIVTPWAFLFLLGRMLVDCTTYFLAVYLRAHKQEPLLWVAVVNAILVGVSTYSFGRFSGSTGVSIANFFAVILTLPLTMRIFVRKRRLWHALSSGPSVASAVV
jgi:O-antigen/teichoic acid export membrane protein